MKKITLLIFATICFASCKTDSIKQPTFMGIHIGQSVDEFNKEIDSLIQIGKLYKLCDSSQQSCIPFAILNTTIYGDTYCVMIQGQVQDNLVRELKLYVKTELNYTKYNNQVYILNDKSQIADYLNNLEGGSPIPYGQSPSYTDFRTRKYLFDIDYRLSTTYGTGKESTSQDSIQIRGMFFKREDGSLTEIFPCEIQKTIWFDENKDIVITLINKDISICSSFYTEIIYEPSAKFISKHKKEFEKLSTNNSF